MGRANFVPYRRAVSPIAVYPHLQLVSSPARRADAPGWRKHSSHGDASRELAHRSGATRRAPWQRCGVSPQKGVRPRLQARARGKAFPRRKQERAVGKEDCRGRGAEYACTHGTRQRRAMAAIPIPKPALWARANLYDPGVAVGRLARRRPCGDGEFGFSDTPGCAQH